MYYATTKSPVGELTLASDGQFLTALHIVGDRYFTAIPIDWIKNEADPVLRQAIAELDEYFEGQRQTFDIPIKVTGTPFQQTVWQALQELPTGSTTSYGELAQVIGKPLAARAVGTAIGRNPICIIIPCHRVLASNGTFGGYVAGLDCKNWLLEREGISLYAKA